MIRNAVIDNILTRRSIRAYTEEKLTVEELDTLLECAVWAPSAMNRQTTKYVAVQDEALMALLAEDDKKFMAPPPPMPGMPKPEGGPKGPMGERKLAYGAPCVILIFDQPEMGGKTINAPLGEENICLAAHSMGLGTCILGAMGAFNDEANAEIWKERLGIPADYGYISCVAVGHPAKPTTPKDRKEGRKIIK